MSKIRRFGCLTVFFAAALALPGLSAAQTYWFFGGGVGHASVDGGIFDDNDTSFKLLGGYAFNPNFSVEGVYADFGEQTSAVISSTTPPTRSMLEANGFGIGVRGEIPLNERFGIYGRVGGFFWDADVDTTGPTPMSVNDDGTDVYFGVGGRVRFNEAVSLFLDYDLFSLDPEDVDMWSLGLQFDFGRR